MIEASTLARLAAHRRAVLIRVPIRPGSDARTTQLVLPLWPEPAAGTFGSWRCLVLERATTWAPVVFVAGDLDLVEMRTDGTGEAHPFPPIDVAAPVSHGDARQLAEAA